jgi:hypothetical protein
MFARNTNPSARELRQFTLIWFPACFAVVGAGLAYYRSAWTAAAVVWGVGLVLTVAGWLRPSFMRLVFVGWMTAVYPIGWAVSHLMLATIFYLVITPVGFLRRWLGGDPLERRFDRAAPTYWVAHNPGGDAARYLRQF